MKNTEWIKLCSAFQQRLNTQCDFYVIFKLTLFY